MFKIIRTKTWKRMLDEHQELEELRGAHIHLHELYKGVNNKAEYEKGQLEDALKDREAEIKDLKKKLRKAEHEKSEAFKKLKKFVDPSRANAV